jgi:hypothetical protein
MSISLGASRRLFSSLYGPRWHGMVTRTQFGTTSITLSGPSILAACGAVAQGSALEAVGAVVNAVTPLPQAP